MKYDQVENIAQAQELLKNKNNNFTILAGGTDVLVEARQKPFSDQMHLLDISRVKELSHIEENGEDLILGALVTHQQICQSPLILKYAPLLAQASRQVGSLQIRNRGTIGGNVCNASPCADTVPALTVLNARLEILSASGSRIVNIENFFEKPYFPRIQVNEMLTRIIFKKLKPTQKSAFYKLGRRNALAISRINMAAVMDTDESGVIREVRLAPGSVFPSWRRVQEAESFLTGQMAHSENFEQAGKLVAAKMIEISGRRWSTPYKEPVVAALAQRVLRMAFDQNRGDKQ